MGFALYLVFLALTYVRPIEAFAPELGVYRPMLFLLLATFAAAVGRAMSTGRIAATGQHVRLILAFTAAVGISVAANGWVGGAVTALVDFAPSVLMFLSTVMLVVTRERLRAACVVFIGSMVVLSIAGAAAFHTGYMADKLVIWQMAQDEEAATEAPPDVVPALDTTVDRIWRIRSLGFLSDPNDFGQALVVSLGMLALFKRRHSTWRNLIVLGIPGLIIFYAIYLTHSRGALLGLAALMFFGIQRRLGTLRTTLLIGGMAVAAMALNFTGGRAYTANEESAGGRIDAWGEGLNMLASRPVFGVGYGQFTDHNYLTAHNSFVLCFAETGLVGYFLWLGLILLVFRQLARAIKLADHGADEPGLAAPLRNAMVGFFTCAVFLSRSYQPGLYILLSLAISAAYCERSVVPAERLEAFDAPIRWRAMTAVAVVLTIVAVYAIVKNAAMGRG
jgi:putative inorganic carbon (hco3(-)) transporter